VAFLIELLDSLVVKVIVAIVGPLLIGATFYLFRRVHRAFVALHHVEKALKAVGREKHGERLLEGPGFWLKQPSQMPDNYSDLRGSSIPILMVAATKGGVGKTSLTGSLAAHFALRWTQQSQEPGADRPLRVLVIDQDFQGSFTTMTIPANERFIGNGAALPSKANQLVSGELCDGKVASVAERISQNGMVAPLPIWVVTSYYDLSQAENRMLVQWLLPLSNAGFVSWLLRLLKLRDPEPRTADRDLRYLLAEALLHPDVRARFDLVIIDSPPRLTTSHIQAMCAATHLLVPTILDNLSGDAVGRYLDQVATHKLGLPTDARLAICPHLQPIGVVCTMVPNNKADLSGLLNELERRVSATRLAKTPIVPQDCFIRQRTPYREHAGERIAYAAVSGDKYHEDLRAEVDRLGDWVAPKLGAEAKGWKRRREN
jgi:cellulose biosynthesis protein BcsQ